MGGMKLWVPPPVVKFGCLMHDEQLSSSASRICRMVAVASIQIAFFVAPVPGPRRWLSMVFLILCTRWCLNVRERRAPESQTPPIFPRFAPSLASLASLSLLLLLLAPLPLPLPAARCPLWWLVGVASRRVPWPTPPQAVRCKGGCTAGHAPVPQLGFPHKPVDVYRCWAGTAQACTLHCGGRRLGAPHGAEPGAGARQQAPPPLRFVAPLQAPGD